jgi:hypothetical protein
MVDKVEVESAGNMREDADEDKEDGPPFETSIADE